MTLLLRAVAYQPNGAQLGTLPTPQGVSGSMVFGDAGAFSIDYPAAGPKAAWLTSACEVALEVSYDGGQTWTEPNDARYLRLRRKGDPTERPGVVSYEGPSYLWLLDKSKVLPEGKLNADGKRPFLSATVGTIMVTLLQEAKARGELPGFGTASFTTTKDSSGADWDKVVTLYYEPGLSYLTVLRNLHDQGLVDFTMAGRDLRLYRADTAMAGSSGARLIRGRDLTEAPYTGTLEGLATDVFLLGDDGLTYQRNNPSAPSPWGKWMEFVSQGGVSDTGTMAVLSDSTLSLASAERVENTYGLDFSRAKSLPFRDYTLGKTIAVTDAAGKAPQDMRLRQITLGRDDKGRVSGNVVLNDRFLENEVRQTRRVQGISGGSTADGGSGARPAPATDKTTPKAPVGLATTTDAYQDNEGKDFAIITLVWDGVTENTDGTAADDLHHYELGRRRTGDTWWGPPIVSDLDTSAVFGGLEPGVSYDVKVRAVDNSGHRSAWSAVVSQVTGDDTVAPDTPSAPTVSEYLGQLLIAYDGTLAGGGTVPVDLARAELHIGAVGFTPTPGGPTLLDSITARTGVGSAVATGLTYGATYEVRVILVDRAGNASPPSAPASGVPVKMGGIDLDTGVVGYDALAFKQAGNAIADGSLEDASYRATLGSFMQPAWSFVDDPANAATGRWRLRADATVSPNTYRQVWLSANAGLTIPNVAPLGSYTPTGVRVQAGEKWLFRAQARGNLNAPLRICLRYYDATGAYLSAGVLNATLTATYATYSTAFTIPANAVYAVPYVELGNTTSTGTADVDDLELRPIIGTLLIDDAAITNAKIGSVSADKITVGTMAAAVVVSGKLATALTGARVELNSTGLKQYDASGLLTVDIPVTGGATFSGTIKTAATGARVEILPVTGGGAVRIYSGYSTESAPGSLSAVVQGSGPTLNGAMYLSSPKRGTYQQATLTLQGEDADGETATVFTCGQGDVHIIGTASGTNGDYGGTLNFRNAWNGTPWFSITRTGTGARLMSNTSAVVLNSVAQTLVSSDTRVTAQAPLIELKGPVTHTGGEMTLSDTYLRTASFTANVGIATSPQGVLYRVGSSARYKVDVADPGEAMLLESVKALRPRTWVDRSQWEDNGERPDGLRRYLGLIAEEVAEIPGLEALVVARDAEGRPDSVDYDRLAVALLPWLHDLERRVTALAAARSGGTPAPTVKP